MLDEANRAVRIGATANFVVMSTTDGVFRHFFDVHSEFGAEVFGMMTEHQDEVSIKMSYLLQETEIDLIDYQGPGVRSPVLYRRVEFPEHLNTISSMVLQNILKVESQYDLKNAFDVGYFLVSFKSGSSEINFVFTPVFVKNFKLTEAYSTWSQLKSLILNMGQDPTYNSPNRQAIISQLRMKLPSSRLCLVGFVESGPEKFHGSTTTLDEITKLCLDLKGIDNNPDSASARRMSQASSTQENQQPEEGDEEADDRHNEFLTSCEQYIASGTELLRTGTDIDTIQEWLNQAEPHQHKLEMMLESCKNQELGDLNKRLQRKLKSLRENLQDKLYSPRQDLNQSESSHSQTQPHSKSRPGPSSQKEVSATFQHSKLYGGDTASQTLGLPPQSPGGVSSMLRGPTNLPKRKNSNLLGMQVYDTANQTLASTYQRKFNPEDYSRKFSPSHLRLLRSRIQQQRRDVR